MLQWGCIVAAITCSVAALGFNTSLTQAVQVQVLMVAGLTLPSSPAQLGTTQLAETLSLSLSDAEAAVAFSASLIYTPYVKAPCMIFRAI